MSPRVKKLLLWGTGLVGLAVLAVLVAVPFAVRKAVSPALVARHASSALDRQVSVGEVGLAFTPLLRIRVERVAIEPDIRLGVVDVGLDVGSLIQGRLEVGVVEVEDASLALVRRADGGIELRGASPAKEPEPEESDPEEPGSGSALPTLPELDLRDIEVSLVDYALGDAPLRTRLWVDHLSLQPLADGERPRLSLAVGLAKDGQAAELKIDARLGPLDLARAWDAQPFDAELQAEGLATGPLAPYLSPHFDLRRLDGPLTGHASVSGDSQGELSGKLDLSLAGGHIHVSGVELSAPHLAGELSRRQGGTSLTGSRLETAGLRFDEYQLEDLDMSFSWDGDSLEVESLEVGSLAGTWRPGEPTAGDAAESDRLEVQMRRSGRVTLRGRLRLPKKGELASGGRALDAELPDLEMRDAEVVITHASGNDPQPVLLLVDRLQLRDVAAGETATARLEARLGEGGRDGSLSLRGSAGPLAWDTPLAKLPVSLQLTLERLDLASLGKILPEPWQLDPAEGRLGGRIDTEGRELANLSLQLDESRLGLRGIGLEGSAKLDGRVRTGAAGLAVEGGLLSVQTVTFAGHRAEDLKARFSYAEDTLGVESLELRAYQGSVSGSGRVGLGGEVPDFDVKLSATGVQAAPLFGTRPRSDEPTLLEAKTAFRGRWTGEPNWLAPLEGGGRVEMRGGVFPSQALLSAVARSLVGLVPGFSRGAVSENPRLAGLDALTSTFRVEAGRLTTDDLSVRTEDMRVTGRGALGHELDLDFRLLVALTTRGVSTAFSMGRTHEQLREGTLLPSVPVRVTGPIGSQRYQVDARAVPVATLRGVLGLPARAGALGRGVGGTVRDTAGGVGSSLLGGARRLRGSGGQEQAEEPPQDLPE